MHSDVNGGGWPAGESFSFCVIADPHCSEGPKKGLEKYGSGKEKFLACMSRMKDLGSQEKPDFVLVLGDIHLWELKDVLHTIDIPLHVIAGNHETKSQRQQMRNLFVDDFQQNGKEADYYSFVHKGVRFIGLCDAVPQDHIGTLSSRDIIPPGQCEWLEAELEQEEARKIIFAHIPPEPDGRDKNMYLARNDSRYLNELTKRYQPAAMFFGHQHRETQISEVGQCRSAIVRSCCWNAKKAPLGFLLVTISPAGVTIREILTGFYE